jgi:hypothetical protein
MQPMSDNGGTAMAIPTATFLNICSTECLSGFVLSYLLRLEF